MFCTSCGAPLLENNQVCLHCGKQYPTQIASPLLRRALLFIEANEWGKADDYCDQVLDGEPENAQAYVIKLMIRTQVKKEEDLARAKESYASWNSYQNACRFASEELRKKLQGYLKSTEDALHLQEEETKKQEELLRQKEWEQKQAALYVQACRYDRNDSSMYDLSEAIMKFEKIPRYKDASIRLQSCKQRLEELKKEQECRQREHAQQEMRNNIKRKTGLVVLVLVAALIAVALIIGVNNANSERAEQIKKHLIGMSFAGDYQKFDSVVSNGSWGLAESVVKYETLFHFEGNDTVTIDSITSYDNAPFTTLNGIRQWDQVDRQSRTTFNWEVNVLLFGRVNVIIDGVQYQLNVNAANLPLSMKRGNVVYKAT